MNQVFSAVGFVGIYFKDRAGVMRLCDGDLFNLNRGGVTQFQELLALWFVGCLGVGILTTRREYIGFAEDLAG